MRACCSPQNAAHWPRHVPAFDACIQVVFSLPGTRSILPIRFGVQKLWMTSAERSSTRSGRPTGTWISLAVVAMRVPAAST